MFFILYVPLIGLVTIGIIFPSILICCCKNNENNENNKLFDPDNVINAKNKINFYDPLLL